MSPVFKFDLWIVALWPVPNSPYAQVDEWGHIAVVDSLHESCGLWKHLFGPVWFKLIK